jgi:DNA-binding NarL/FixJ family response regulator
MAIEIPQNPPNPSTPSLEVQSTEDLEHAGGVRVILADTQAIYRVGIRKVFAVEDDIRVVAQAENFPGLLLALERYPADVVLLEGNLVGNAVESIPEIMRRAPDAKLIVQVVETKESSIVDLYRRGVRGVVARSIPPDLLVRCVRKIAMGETWIDNQSVSWVIEAYRAQANQLTSPRVQPRLTPRELEIMACITQGMRNKEIAYKLSTTEQVVKNYLRKIYDKLGVSDRLELALYCLHHQILKQQMLNGAPDVVGDTLSAAGQARLPAQVTSIRNRA